MLTSILLADDPPPLLTGTDASTAIWNAVGPGLSLIAVLVIIFVFFVGQNRNIKAGIACLIGLAILIAIAVNTSILQGWGSTITGILSKPPPGCAGGGRHPARPTLRCPTHSDATPRWVGGSLRHRAPWRTVSDESRLIVGRTHTDLYRGSSRVRNLFGKDGINLTKLSADGIAVNQLVAVGVVAAVWSVPLATVFHITPIGLHGFGIALSLAPPLLAGWVVRRRLPHKKTLWQWIIGLWWHMREPAQIVAGKPARREGAFVVRSKVWSPNKGGLVS